MTEGSALPREVKKKIIHFTSGETLEVEDSEMEEEEEEAEQSTNKPPFEEPAEKTKLSFKNVVILIGRISLLACDFLGERLAGALGLNAAKYQYAVDQYHRHHQHKQTRISQTDGLQEAQTETSHLSARLDGSHYGAAGNGRDPAAATAAAAQESPAENRGKTGGCHNRGYQADEERLE
ncbi:protein FAM177A1 isoform 1-T5 [Pholidichthys leucotaenia]